MILLVEEQPELGEPITVYPETTSPLTRELADTGIVNDYAAIGGRGGDASRGRRHHHDDDETHAPMSRFEKIFLTLMVIGFLLVLGNAVQKWNATPQPTSYDVQLPTL